MKLKILPFFASIGAALLSLLSHGNDSVMSTNELRFYASLPKEIEVSRFNTIFEMELSYALSGGLTEWSSDKKIVGGLAKSWTVSPDGREIRFQLRESLKWSDGKGVTAAELVAGWKRNIELFGDSLRSLTLLSEGPRAEGADLVVFVLNKGKNAHDLLKKLTEPNYGAIALKGNRDIDVSRTVGPYYVVSKSASEIALASNTNWYRSLEFPDRPKNIRVRSLNNQPSKSALIQDILVSDPWPNFALATSAIDAAHFKALSQSAFSKWTRTPDKTMLLRLLPKTAAKAHRLLKTVASVRRSFDVTSFLPAVLPARELFTDEFPLHIGSNKISSIEMKPDAPNALGRKVKILTWRSQSISDLKPMVSSLIREALGVDTVFETVELNQLASAINSSDADFFLTAVGLSDPDVDGIMSFLFEDREPGIQFVDRTSWIEELDKVRKRTSPSDRVIGHRELLATALQKGYFVPLFHYSLVGLGKPPVDLSDVPNTDESVTFSKIRLK